MKSKISLFNWGICKNLLSRCWPLWLAYLSVTVLILPVNLTDNLKYNSLETYRFTRHILQSGVSMVFVSVLFMAFAAMLMFSYLYSARSAGMMSSLPLRRETLFVTAFLTGLVPMLIIDVLVMLLTAVITTGYDFISFADLLMWLGLTVMGNLAFYGFAVFCAMLTGNIIIMPIVYLVLNLAVFVAESSVRALLGCFVYGMDYFSPVFLSLSPLAYILNDLLVSYHDEMGYVVMGYKMLAVYSVAGVILAAAALLIYRRRHMETATDVVAVPILKPVFKYCMAGGTAVFLAYIIYDGFFRYDFHGIAAPLFIIFLMCLGAFVGYFGAEMLMQKTVRVFSGRWKGYVLSCCVLAAFTLAFEFDLFGYERHIPAVEDISAVRLTTGDSYLEQPENVKKAIALHQQIINNKVYNEKAENVSTVYIMYILNDGSSVNRRYRLAGSQADHNNPESDILGYQKLCNLQEAIGYRCEADIPISEETVSFLRLYRYGRRQDGEYYNESIEFTAQEAVDFYRNYLLKDIENGKIARRWIVENDEYYDTMSNLRFEMELSDRSLLPVSQRDNPRHEFFTFNVGLDSENCLRWIAEHTEFEPLPLRIAEPPGKG